MELSSKEKQIHRIVNEYIEPLQVKIIEHLTKLTKEPLPDSKNPEWVICIKEKENLFGELNMVYQVLKIENDSYYFELNSALNKSLVRKATKAEVAAHQLGFHLGDPITFGHTSKVYGVHSIGNITGFKYDGYDVLYVETDKDKSAVLDDNIKIDNPKITTQEGDKIYEGGKCWYVPFLAREFDESNYDDWEGNENPNGKYFSEEKNAKQYFAEVQPQKRNIRIDILNKHLLFNPSSLLAKKKKYKKLYDAALKAMEEYAVYVVKDIETVEHIK